MISRRSEVLLCICKGPHSNFRAVFNSRVKELERFSVEWLVKVPLVSGPVMSGDEFHDGLALTDGNTAFKCAADTSDVTSTFSGRGTVSEMASTTSRSLKQGLGSHSLLVEMTWVQ